MSLHFFGIRHHGPGCARALQRALQTLQPDIVLLEGPPEAEDILPLATDEAMVPPVAMLVYPSEAPQHGVFYPFAGFSPEWIAIRYALQQQIPLRLMDLPLTHRFAACLEADQQASEPADTDSLSTEQSTETDSNADAETQTATGENPAPEADWISALRMDPLAELSRAAGYEDQESWWEREIEQRSDSNDLFLAIQEAMTALREHAPQESLRDQQREAAMRQKIREAEKAGYQRIAVVCGAWHVPALAGKHSVKQDQALLKGLGKAKTCATWVPWSSDRLAYESGYGAGISSPGWYAHLWQSPDQAGLRWVTEAARLMRDAGLDASSASVIETVRLAEATAAMRDLPMAGLRELREAMLAVLCHGEAAPLQLIREQLEIGHHLGSVPPSAAAAPLQRDLEMQQKSLRLKPETVSKLIELDLREPNGRARSRLLHQLTVLGIHWGKRQSNSNRQGTFRESWLLEWRPEMAIRLIETSRYGNRIAEAAAACLSETARQADLPALTGLLDVAVLAELPKASAELLLLLQNQAALANDITHLMQALPPLVSVARYGDVRGTSQVQVLPIIHSLTERIMLGLPLACTGIDEASAEHMVSCIEGVQKAMDTLAEQALADSWFTCLQKLYLQDSIAPGVQGYALRLCYDKQRIDDEALMLQTHRMLSSGSPVAMATTWLSGLLSGSGLLLLHQDALWQIIDQWLSALPDEIFMERLALLRRAFSGFTPSERRQMGDKVRHLGSDGKRRAPAEIRVDTERASAVLPFLQHLLKESTV